MYFLNYREISRIIYFRTQHARNVGNIVLNPIKENIRQSPLFSLCMDETTDVTVCKELVYARYIITDGEVTVISFNAGK